mmetsp:Transcript_8091/g.18249  ORF Transcript_8091/g.18249 Transcript_8091/m.18249 type:complete len:441 (-) Transcript_8091:82-1404(-)
MIPGSRVQVHTAEGIKKGKIISLIPLAIQQLRYRVKLDEKLAPSDGDDNSDVFTVNKIELLEHSEEVAYDTLHCNSLCYCQAHRLEVCGKCGMDHRWNNICRQIAESECNGRDPCEVVDDIQDRITPRVAPKGINASSDGGITSKSFKVDYIPVVSGALLLPSEYYADPDSLPLWPSNRPFYDTLKKCFDRSEKQEPDETKAPLRRLRETIAVAGHRWDKFLHSKTEKDPMGRLIMQDDAQTQILCMDLILPVHTSSFGGMDELPLFTIRWVHSGLGRMEHAMMAMTSMEPGTKMGEIETETDEIELMAKLLMANTVNLSSEFKTNHRHPRIEHQGLLRVSVLTEIPFKLQQEYYRNLGDYCNRCGASGHDNEGTLDGTFKVMKCSKCKSAQYCSRECQRVHWKVHKTNCEAVVNRANSQQIMTMAHTADEDSRQKRRRV